MTMSCSGNLLFLACPVPTAVKRIQEFLDASNLQTKKNL